MNYCILTRGDEVSLELKKIIKDLIKLEYNEETPMYVICIGGDGTILKAVQRYQHIISDIVIFGIKTGTLGFYSNYEKTEYMEVVNSINKRNFLTEQWPTLTYNAKGLVNISGLALNEITVMSAHRTLVLDIHVDDEKLMTCRGTGVCVSTPSGSTAYNKSLNGAIVDLNVKGLQLTEIAPINSKAFRSLGTSILFNDENVLTLRNITPNVCITADNTYYESMVFDEIMIETSDVFVTMAIKRPRSFVSKIKEAFLNG